MAINTRWCLEFACADASRGLGQTGRSDEENLDGERLTRCLCVCVCLQVLTPSSGLLDFAISMRPDYHHAIIDTVRHYGWKKIIYLYDSHDGEFLCLSCLFGMNFGIFEIAIMYILGRFYHVKYSDLYSRVFCIVFGVLT